jgi:nitronate monooxygenase
MTLETGLTKALGVKHSLVQGPMAGGPTTPRLVAAVSSAGALGSLGAACLPPDTLREQIAQIRSLTEGPFNVNLFVPLPYEADPARIGRVGELLSPYRRELGIEDPGTPSTFEEDFYDQLEVVLKERVPVFSFTFGSPGPDLTGRLRDNGTYVLGTATTVEEGIRLERDGVDAVVA